VKLDGVIAAAAVISEALRRELTSRQWVRTRKGASCCK
jgi:hypothetical protein